MPERWVVDNDPSPRFPIYTRGNVGEVFPDPVAPFSWTLWGIPHAEPGWAEALARFGAFDTDEFTPGVMETLGVFGGYAYLNVSVTRIFGARVPGMSPEAVDQTFFGSQAATAPPYAPGPDDESPVHAERSARTLEWILAATELPEQAASREKVRALRAQRPDLRALSDRQLLERTRELINTHWRGLWVEHIFLTHCALVPPAILAAVAAALGDPGLVTRVITGLGAVDSALPAHELWRLSRQVARSTHLQEAFDDGVDGLRARLEASVHPDAAAFVSAFDAFLYQHGARGFNEWEMRSRTFETHPEIAWSAIDRIRRAPDSADPVAAQQRLAGEREEAVAQVAAALEADPEVRGQFVAGAQAARTFLAGRERTKTNAITLVHEARMTMRELGRRFVQRGVFAEIEDFGMLTDDEWSTAISDPAGVPELLVQRKEQMAALAALDAPFIVAGTVPPLDTWQPRTGDVAPVEAGDVLQGVPGCSGTATGRVRVVADPSDPRGLEPGDVLVAEITDSSWTPLFVPAGAVVVDQGATVSHAVIVSRELGIPCVVSVGHASRALRDGQVVSVDGAAGTVTVVE
ncbi:phosphoenolpyruvate-utilizing protein [Xylanimonas allomyrinae]|uniref:Phosphoenolpyruvate-utilizing protein n=1 Tax=Xylanimonas allomyrinae TaxID=2509459 RepID=A0A4P6EPU1_9MICO|nr:PEP-utilizing enzyme [Xylanimonas allomyrinae]QAY62287.1 phosphoenolpyruvate-utilizing protein [Xylanimonas allomyrinae]